MSDEDEGKKDEGTKAIAKASAEVIKHLTNKISKGTGEWWASHQRRRMADAEAYERLSRARTDVELRDIERRAAQRWIEEEVQNQENLEAIMRKAIPDLAQTAKPEKISDDWSSIFRDYAKKVSDEEMQSLWAKILAGEANAPGSFRKRVLHSVSLLEKEDAELFTTLCRFCVTLGTLTPVIFNVESDSLYAKQGLDFRACTHLDAVGLIRFDSVSGFARQKLPGRFMIGYGDKIYTVQVPDGKEKMSIGKVLFTEVGRQLAPLSNAKAVSGFDTYFIEQWKNEGIDVAHWAAVTPSGSQQT